MQSRRTPSLPTVASLCTVLAVAAACTGGPTGATSNSTGADATAPPTGTAAPDDDLASASDRPSTPLAAYLAPNGGQGLTAAQQAEADREGQAWEEAVAACMAEQGFTYEVPSLDDGAGADAGIWSLPRDEFVATYGYGITTVSRADAAGARTAEAERLEAMSAAERRAYYQALYGDAIPLDEDGYVVRTREPMLAAPDDTTPGCTTKAAEAVSADDGAGTGPTDRAAAVAEFQPLLDDLQQLWQRIDDDPRVREAAAAWADCMAGAGFPGYAWPDDPEADVVERLEALTAGLTRPTDAARGLPGLDAALEQDPEAVEELRTFELDVAAADHACTGPFADVRHDVQVELEQAFVDAHRDRLEAYRDTMGLRGGVG